MLLRKNPKPYYQLNRFNQFLQTSLLQIDGLFCISLVQSRPILIGHKVFTDTRFNSSKNEAALPQTFAQNINNRNQ